MSQFPEDRTDPVPSTPSAQPQPDPSPVAPVADGAQPPKPPRRKPVRRKGPKGSRLIRHFKVDHRLTPEDRVPYEALLLDPRQTADSLLKWLHDRGYTDVSRAGVARHRRQFEGDVKNIRRDARVAVQFASMARAQGGPSALTDAGQFRFEQMFFEQLFQMKKSDERGGRDWLELARTMTSVLENRQQVEQQRADWQRRAKQAVEAVEKAAGAGRKVLDGVAVADAVRRILGVPLPHEPLPPAPPPVTEWPGGGPRGPRGLPSPSDN